MAEKIRDGVDGLHFRAASAEGLVDRLIEALRTPDLWDRLRARVPRPISAIEAAEQHRALYDRLLAQRARRGQTTEASSRRARRPAPGDDLQSHLRGTP